MLPAVVPLPGGEGFLPVNAYVLMADEPVLLDSGLGIDRADFLAAVSSIVPLDELKWIWLTHDDADHTGNMEAIFAAAPNARLVTNAFNAMRMSTWCEVPFDRVYAIRPGDSLSVGDRTLRAIAPPVFDNPNSIGAFDESTGTLFSVDAFGAIIPEVTEDADQIPTEALTQGMMGWAAMDAPWTRIVDERLFDVVLEEIAALQPSHIMSSHLPAAGANIKRYLDTLRMLPGSDPILPPSNVEFSEMLAAMGG